MPNPKKHHSHMRTRMRRSQWKVVIANTIRCPQCGDYKISHRICPNCGYYKGELWMTRKEKSKVEESGK